MDPQVCPPPLNSSQSMLSNSLEKSPASAFKPSHSRNSSSGSSRLSKQSRNWEVMDMDMGLIPGSAVDQNIPGICEGYLLKRRKYPLRGWHQRYFLLEKGILKYCKTQQDHAQRGKVRGSLDVSLAVMSTNKTARRIDLDAGDNLYHIKAKTHELFYIWLTKLCAHRVYKKNEAIKAHHGVLHALAMAQGPLPAMSSLSQRSQVSPGMPPFYACSAPVHQTETDAPAPAFLPGINSKVSAWLQQTHDTDAASQELARCQVELTELAQLIQRLHWLEGGMPLADGELERRISMQNITLEKPQRKFGKVFGHSRTMSRVEAMGGMFTSSHLSTSTSSHIGASVASIPDYVYCQLSNPQVNSPEAKKIHQDICLVSQRVHASLRSVHEVLAQERDKVREAWTGQDLGNNASQQLASLSELDVQSRLTKVHSLSLSSESTEESFCTIRQDQATPSAGRHHRAPSVAESMAEYFDASEVIVCESSSDNEASDESGLSDITTTSNSEPDEGHATATIKYRNSVSSAPDKPLLGTTDTGRRTVLPAHGADNSHIGIMNILYNNIGKDLSRISMPAALNEPLCLLQRMSEELEYTELLDIANRTDDPFVRMVYVAAFSISGYAWASWRNRYKPFNPVLGETYESHRPDRGFHFISEQVSHHPPISACHAESENFVFWQDQRWKNKFWGKSVEIISSGPVNVSLPKYGDHYEWNKVVTCIHNVLSQTRNLEHYGEVLIKNNKSNLCTCKITFIKSRYWSSDGGTNEVQGVVLDRSGEVVHRFGGLWHEGIFCDTLPTPQCIWKPTMQPDDYALYYGFSRYARELNELTPDLKPLLPPTDTRFRPDQRILEEGKVAEADKIKDEVEEKQRARRKVMEKKGKEHVPRFFSQSRDEAGRDVWLYSNNYWSQREDPGFAHTENLDLW